jgi:hypothetical protein
LDCCRIAFLKSALSFEKGEGGAREVEEVVWWGAKGRAGEREGGGSLTGLGEDRYAVRLAESGCGARNFQAPFARDPRAGRLPPRGGKEGPLEHRVECA